MKYLVWTAAFVLLLDLSISLDFVDIPCKDNNGCKNMIEPPSTARCDDGHCKCLTTNGVQVNCTAGMINGSTEAGQRNGQAGLIGHVCNLDKECSVSDINALCNTTNKQCACKSGFFASENNDKCLAGIGYGESGCVESVQCRALTSNTTCLEGVCKCRENYHFESKACWVNKDIGASCTATEECLNVAQAVCDHQHICSCPSDKVIHPNGTECLSKASKIEDQCVESIQCDHLGGVCLNGRCQCPEHHHHSSATNECQMTKKVNDACETDHDCSQTHHDDGKLDLKCIDKVCACVQGLHYDNDKGICVDERKSAANRLMSLGIFATSLMYFGLLAAIL
ncbi:prion-like-(Q/N-rich) domain-bearing protein 25 isoform X1 [Neodiprion lecontei]|uniref:Prion-like-(Q/N-rich) domain-bearing protein 25 isoform X1 n=1 Tax=Neodiprion lecontei TaxID=441921 RepID=A0A6J0BHE3_NEOLC|nr:prion-like-(Q/N-rich) domain-bearing protein 25 isoform X1 [Neodiprion lecontei]